MTTTEPEWTQQEQGWMLALAMWRASRCPNCGRDIEECTAPDASFRVPLPTRCHASTALEIARKPYEDTPQSASLLWNVERR